MSEILVTLTLDDLRDLLQQAGYRVETVTDPVANVAYLRSATSGLSFDIRPGYRLVVDENVRFADMAFVSILQVNGELPRDLVNDWNVARRFSRLQSSGPFLALCMDISIVGGVTKSHLRAHIEIWDQLAQGFIVYLRDRLRGQQANGADRGVETDATAPASDDPATGFGAPTSH